jgi:predicted RNA binding protein YcfA (HicA-like mRNA interferase family)
MSPKLRRLSGHDVTAILRQLGFSVVSQRGSHLKLRRTGAGSGKETLTIPLHDELDAGTLRAIMRQASRYIPEEQLRPLFYQE